MNLVWLSLFIVSAGLLAYTLLRSRGARRFLGFVGLNLMLGAIFLYIINLAGARIDFYLPLNAATVGTVGLLGFPGVLLLVLLRFTLPL